MAASADDNNSKSNNGNEGGGGCVSSVCNGNGNNSGFPEFMAASADDNNNNSKSNHGNEGGGGCVSSVCNGNGNNSGFPEFMAASADDESFWFPEFMAASADDNNNKNNNRKSNNGNEDGGGCMSSVCNGNGNNSGFPEFMAASADEESFWFPEFMAASADDNNNKNNNRKSNNGNEDGGGCMSSVCNGNGNNSGFPEFMAASADDNNNNNSSKKSNNGNEGGGGCVRSVRNGNVNNSGFPVAGDDYYTSGFPVPGDDYYNYVFGATIACLKHDPGLSLNWSPDEIPIIHHLFIKHASDSIVTKYAKIAQELNDKTSRDVILYQKWLIQKAQSYKSQGKKQVNTDIAKKKGNRKWRKDDNSSRKNKDKMKEVADPSAKSSSYLTNRSNDHPYAQTAASMDSDDGISYKAIGGATGRLLEHNAQAMDQISANFRAFKIHDNINLFSHARNNILSILNDLKGRARGYEEDATPACEA